jgi:hypothetical protein
MRLLCKIAQQAVTAYLLPLCVTHTVTVAVACSRYRDSLGPLSAVRDGRVCMRAWLRAELLRLATMLVVLFFIAWPWGVAVSRWVCGCTGGCRGSWCCCALLLVHTCDVKQICLSLGAGGV